MLSDRIARALRYSNGEYTVEDVLQKIAQGHIVPLEFKDCLVCVEVHVFPQRRILNIFLVEGKGLLKQVPLILEKVTQIAKHMDCSAITCYGRKGWERVLARYNTKPVYVVMSLELNDETDLR